MGTYFSLILSNVIEFTITLSLLQSCAILTESPKVDPVLEPYYQEYLYYTKRKRSNIIIKFGTLIKDEGDRAVGVCNYLFKEITIDKGYWKNASEIKRKALVWHELGHCDLFLLHNNSMFGDMCPKSVMNSFIPSEWCLNKYWEKYKREFRKD